MSWPAPSDGLPGPAGADEVSGPATAVRIRCKGATTVAARWSGCLGRRDANRSQGQKIRMALGQLLDYGRYVEHSACALLVPTRPSEDLELLLRRDIAVVWRNEGEFRDNRVGAFV